METFLFISGLYIASVFLNRFLNQISVRYFNDVPCFGIWFLSLFTTFLFIVYFTYEINKRYQPFKFPSKWFKGESWCHIEGWKRFRASELYTDKDYDFILNHNADKIIIGTLSDDRETVTVREKHCLVNPNYPVIDQISHYRGRWNNF